LLYAQGKKRNCDQIGGMIIAVFEKDAAERLKCAEILDCTEFPECV